MCNEEYKELKENNLVDFIKQNIYPPLGGEYDWNILKKYGYTISGIYDGWEWKENIDTATEEELWQIIAICEWYWAKQYKKWYNKSCIKSNKLDNFIGICERNWFGYDEDGYTDKTIDRIFNSIINILKNKK